MADNNLDPKIIAQVLAESIRLREEAQKNRDIIKDQVSYLKESKTLQGEILSLTKKLYEVQRDIDELDRDELGTSQDVLNLDKQILKAKTTQKQLEKDINILGRMGTKNANDIAVAIQEQIDKNKENLKILESQKSISKEIRDNAGVKGFGILSEIFTKFGGKGSLISEPFKKASDATREIVKNGIIKNQKEKERRLSIIESIKKGELAASKTNLEGMEVISKKGKTLLGVAAKQALIAGTATVKNIETPLSKTSLAMQGLLAGVTELGSSLGAFLKGPIWITALVEAAKFFIGAMFEADNRVTKLAKGLLLSKDEAKALYNNFKDSKHEIDSIYNLTKDYYEAFSDLVDLSDFAVIANQKMVETQIILTKNLGLSKEEALGAQEAFVASNVEANKGKDIVYDQIAAFANQNKLIISGKKLFTDIAKTSKLIQINFNGNLNELVKTTLEAKKLGLSLDQVKKVSESLLDFEQSISSELEAELLTGKDLNLERARAYALNHDMAGLTQEIANQGITQEKFAAMNIIQQQAIAKTLGMSAEEMGDILYKQEVINEKAGDFTKELRKQAILAEKEKRFSDANALKRKADLLEQGILSGKSLEEAEKSTSAQEKFNQSLEQAKEIFSDFVDGGTLDKFADFLNKFVNSVAIKGLGRTLIGGLVDEEDIAKYKIKEKKKTLELESDPERKKQLQEEINQLNRQLETGFEKQIKSGQTGIEAQQAYRSVQRNEIMYAGVGPKFADGGIITKRINNATIGEAGPEAVIPLNQLMNEFKEMKQILTAILHKEGTITLNGTKMGTAMAVGAYKIQ